MPRKSVDDLPDLPKAKETRFEQVLPVLSISLRGSGEKRTGLSPIPSHSGEQTNETFCVHFGEQWFSCKQCKKKGNVLDFAQAWFGKGLKHAALWLFEVQAGTANKDGVLGRGADVEKREESVAAVSVGNGSAPERAVAAEGERDTVFEHFVEIMEAAAQKAFYDLILQHEGNEYELSWKLAKFFVGARLV